jgi:hypothetical protein
LFFYNDRFLPLQLPQVDAAVAVLIFLGQRNVKRRCRNKKHALICQTLPAPLPGL